MGIWGQLYFEQTTKYDGFIIIFTSKDKSLKEKH